MHRDHPEEFGRTKRPSRTIDAHEKAPIRIGAFLLPNEFEVRIRIGEGILHEVLLEIRISLLVVRHRRIAEMVEIHVFDAIRVRIGEPTVDETRASLDSLSVGAGERDEVRGRVSRIIQHREPCDDFSIMPGDVTLDVVRRDCRHRAVILDVVLLVEVFYRRIAEGVHEFEIGYDVDGGAGCEKFLSCPPGSFVPFFLVIGRIDHRETRLGKMGAKPHVFPSLGNLIPPGGYPYHESGTETH